MDEQLIADRAVARLSNQRSELFFQPVLSSTDLLYADWPYLTTKHVMNTHLFDLPHEFYSKYPLIGGTLKPSTHGGYQRALEILRCDLNHKNNLFMDLDKCVERLATSLYSENPAAGQRQIICNTVSALSHRIPALRDHLLLSRRSLKGWARTLTPRQATPLTFDLVRAFAGSMFRNGYGGAAHC